MTVTPGGRGWDCRQAKGTRSHANTGSPVPCDLARDPAPACSTGGILGVRSSMSSSSGHCHGPAHPRGSFLATEERESTYFRAQWERPGTPGGPLATDGTVGRFLSAKTLTEPTGPCRRPLVTNGAEDVHSAQVIHAAVVTCALCKCSGPGRLPVVLLARRAPVPGDGARPPARRPFVWLFSRLQSEQRRMLGPR